MGRWITHGDWYPDYSLRLLRNGKGQWKGSREHDQMHVDGKVLKLKGDLYHYTVKNIEDHLSKVSYFGNIFLQRQLDKKAKWSSINVVFRVFWRFFRAYFIRLGFLDGYPGFYVAFFTAFSAFYRHTLLYEHNQKDIEPNEGNRK